jgi:hypothetical protein
MKRQRYCVYGSDQHEKLNKVPLRWEPEMMICQRSPWHGSGRDVGRPWIGIATATMIHRDVFGRRFAVPKGSEVYHWEANHIKFVAWKSIGSGISGGRMTLRELCR